MHNVRGVEGNKQSSSYNNASAKKAVKKLNIVFAYGAGQFFADFCFSLAILETNAHEKREMSVLLEKIVPMNIKRVSESFYGKNSPGTHWIILLKRKKNR